MKLTLLRFLLRAAILSGWPVSVAFGSDELSRLLMPVDLNITEADLRAQGAFGFPQEQATTVCDTADLRLSIGNDAKYFFAQAIVWQDDDSALGETADGRAIGDYSSLLLDVDADGAITARVDRVYLLNVWPTMPGLTYQIKLGAGSSTTIKRDTGGRGAIRYVRTPQGRRIRVDIFAIPLAEISRHVGDKIRVCYYGYSPRPKFTVDSAGYGTDGKPYYSHQIPLARYHDWILRDSPALGLERMPDGRTDRSAVAPRIPQPMPVVGTMAPEFVAADWLNVEAAPSLASLRGKVVLLEFWATWCGPCINAIPHLNELQEKYAARGFSVIALTDQTRQGVVDFVRRNQMKYTVGAGSAASFDRYGINGIPQAFLLDGTGRIVWAGHAVDGTLEKTIEAALRPK